MMQLKTDSLLRIGTFIDGKFEGKRNKSIKLSEDFQIGEEPTSNEEILNYLQKIDSKYKVWEHTGEYENNICQGYGEFQNFRDNSIYKGNFVNGLKHTDEGVVIEYDPEKVLPDKTIIRGTWRNDQLVGKGTAEEMPIVSLNTAFGHLPNTINQPDLQAFQSQSSNPRMRMFIQGWYTGPILDGKPFAEQGSARYSDGAVYSGNWKHGKRNGNGLHEFPDKSSYVGKWVGDRRCGHGILSLPQNLIIYEGNWSENVYHGVGVEIDFQNDIIYEGQFRFGFREGTGNLKDRKTFQTIENNSVWIHGHRSEKEEAKLLASLTMKSPSRFEQSQSNIQPPLTPGSALTRSSFEIGFSGSSFR
jgi:hypothetical protein